MSWPFFPWEGDTITIVLETGWAPWSVWMDTENLIPTWIWSLDHPAHRELLYQVRCLSQVCTKCSSCCTLFTLFWNLIGKAVRMMLIDRVMFVTWGDCSYLIFGWALWYRVKPSNIARCTIHWIEVAQVRLAFRRCSVWIPVLVSSMTHILFYSLLGNVTQEVHTTHFLWPDNKTWKHCNAGQKCPMKIVGTVV